MRAILMPVCAKPFVGSAVVLRTMPAADALSTLRRVVILRSYERGLLALFAYHSVFRRSFFTHVRPHFLKECAPKRTDSAVLGHIDDAFMYGRSIKLPHELNRDSHRALLHLTRRGG